MKEWFRRIPHFSYGNFGGADRHKDPVDEMDKLFRKHDADLRSAKKITDKKLRKRACKQADKDLGRALQYDLSPYHRKIYGPLYRFFASLIFRP